MKLKPVDSSDTRFLFNLLKERPKHANISHSTMPKYTTHKEYVDTYLAGFHEIIDHWYIVTVGNKKVGTVYLTRNDEIGIHIRSVQQRKGYGSQAVQAVMDKFHLTNYYANVSPRNKTSQAMFKAMGFDLIQYTYKKKGPTVLGRKQLVGRGNSTD